MREEDRRKIVERKESKILNYELLNFNSPDKRSEPNRRSGVEHRMK